MKVEELMTRIVATCDPDDTLEDAAAVMRDHDCGVVPVVRDDGRVIGVVTDRDICMAALETGQQLASIPVPSAMSRAVLVCMPDDDVRHAEEQMRRAQVRRLPVTDAERRIVGILSMNDIALAAEHPRSNGIDRIQLQEVGHTLAAISEHTHPPIRPNA